MTFNFQDIFQSSFLEYTGAISMLDMALALALYFALGLFIFFVYKKRECVAHLRNVQRRRQTIMNLWVRVKEIDRRYERLM